MDIQSERSINQLSEKMIEGMKIAIRKLIEEAAVKDRGLVPGDEYGNVKRVPVREPLKKSA
ncbi:hypothetical protein [Chitinophaga pinensis]|uniref:Uncharacterized protein n=1 Tax=Chitinophaga pinensis TaxID=79329 RepID=A0A5C6LW10_9BACT|nr:hypothetical protein [Chitinophaga pinensis]TWW00710.1 hypothetical protein FEF09_09410 [Chitinophaga pinensis]